ncbi:hypothetical protein NP493_535g01044 [Ridgeia piscesae]|uniref:Dephospho-CoA kinase domain-containing protein n=1 Tax=Ridgeia piscesae TaxID=27915 RepID=A0AAD9KVS5_RIDPI|nr:hypothetical protein NP493_535g01044 [Ridgeia piscesae]
MLKCSFAVTNHLFIVSVCPHSIMFLVGLTGGIATGKSTVADMFMQLDCPLVDADKIAKEVVQPGHAAWFEIKRKFGDEVIQEDGHLKRDVLAKVIFADGEKRKLLNRITHPRILKSMLWKLLTFVFAGEQFVILDIPLLYETKKLLPYIFYSVVIFCDKDTQLERLQNRNNYSAKEAQQRIDAQLPLEEKCKQATYIIDNSGSTEETWTQVKAVHAKLRSCKAHWVVRFILGLIAFVAIFLSFWGARATMSLLE